MFIGNAISVMKCRKLGSSYDADASALFTRMLAAGEEPTDERKTLINTAIIALKAASLFDIRLS